jgi:hypothetical protein
MVFPEINLVLQLITFEDVASVFLILVRGITTYGNGVHSSVFF